MYTPAEVYDPLENRTLNYTRWELSPVLCLVLMHTKRETHAHISVFKKTQIETTNKTKFTNSWENIDLISAKPLEYCQFVIYRCFYGRFSD